MIDLILFTFFCALFALGFWCGKTYNTYEALWEAVKKKLTS